MEQYPVICSICHHVFSCLLCSGSWSHWYRSLGSLRRMYPSCEFRKTRKLQTNRARGAPWVAVKVDFGSHQPLSEMTGKSRDMLEYFRFWVCLQSVPWQACFASWNSAPYISAYNSHCFTCFAWIQTSINTLTHIAVFFTFHVHSVLNPLVHQASLLFFFASHRDSKALRNSDEAWKITVWKPNFFQINMFVFFFLSWGRARMLLPFAISNFVTK